MQTKVATGISFHKDMLEKIDKERQDVSRSKYVEKIIEQMYAKNKNKKDLPDIVSRRSSSKSFNP